MIKLFITRILTSILIISGTVFLMQLIKECSSDAIYNLIILIITIIAIIVISIPENKNRYWIITVIDKNHTYNTFTVSASSDDLSYLQPIAPILASGSRIASVVEVDKFTFNAFNKKNKKVI